MIIDNYNEEPVSGNAGDNNNEGGEVSHGRDGDLTVSHGAKADIKDPMLKYR